MKTSPIEITIAIPTFRRTGLLADALLSATSQTFSGSMEILVVENPSDCSKKGEYSPAERLCKDTADIRVRYVRNDANLGMIGNWNRCLKLARGHWVVILHDDDWLSPHYVTVSLGLLRANPDIRLIGCKGTITRERAGAMNDKGQPELVKCIRLSLMHFLLENPFFASGVMVHRETAIAFGGFDQAWYPTMDYALWLRFVEVVPCARIEKPMVHYYIGNNESLQPTVLTGYIANDFRLRSDLLSRHFTNNRLLIWYSRSKVYREHKHLQSLFKININMTELIVALEEVGWAPMPTWLHWTYLPIRLTLEVASQISNLNNRIQSTPKVSNETITLDK